MARTDSLGEPLEPGDYVLSASTTSGRMKLGRIYTGQNRYGTSSGMEVSQSFVNGRREEVSRRRQPLGDNVVVLCKADGAIPEAVREFLSAAQKEA
ncbi:hypothetical protein ACFY1Q_11770 [Streptomyces albidoflavus]